MNRIPRKIQTEVQPIFVVYGKDTTSVPPCQQLSQALAQSVPDLAHLRFFPIYWRDPSNGPSSIESPTTGRKIIFLPWKKTNVALLPVTRLFFQFITLSRSRRSPPSKSPLTSPDLLSLYRPLEKEQIEIVHFHPTFSSFSLFFSIYS